jgi:hypothetical protein
MRRGRGGAAGGALGAARAGRTHPRPHPRAPQACYVLATWALNRWRYRHIPGAPRAAGRRASAGAGACGWRRERRARRPVAQRLRRRRRRRRLCRRAAAALGCGPPALAPGGARSREAHAPPPLVAPSPRPPGPFAPPFIGNLIGVMRYGGRRRLAPQPGRCPRAARAPAAPAASSRRRAPAAQRLPLHQPPLRPAPRPTRLHPALPREVRQGLQGVCVGGRARGGAALSWGRKQAPSRPTTPPTHTRPAPAQPDLPRQRALLRRRRPGPRAPRQLPPAGAQHRAAAERRQVGARPGAHVQGPGSGQVRQRTGEAGL